MDWHARYLQQAGWTRELRTYLFDRAGLSRARQVLEVGCGTGAILGELETTASLHGLDIDPAALAECRINAPKASLTQSDGHCIPFTNGCFDIVYCHFLLLWVKDPLQVVIEMARVGRDVLVLAEPDYAQRVDEPPELKQIGVWQKDSLRRQGADPSFGSRLAETCSRAGIRLIETGPIQDREVMRSAEEWDGEWSVIESDLEGRVTAEEIQKMRTLDQTARSRGERKLYVPTYFVWGRISE